MLNVKDYAEYQTKFGPYPGEHHMHIAFRQVAAFFEAVGILLKKKLIDIDLAYEIFLVQQRWETLWPIIRDLRKELDFPEYMDKFEYLYHETQKYRRQVAANI
jgi:hypothetical protein